ncbi:MAG: hypothetical protein IIC13_04570 [SAR324 cluster bacterium]|nr:hypothetical protein [SAR324 cluster bacterium]MCH8885844.1 hypothetical protein [SAR324 cluster bacterium]
MPSKTDWIRALTPEQEVLLTRFRDEWEQIELCTDAADRPRAEAAIANLYRDLGKNVPRFVWCDSPLSAYRAMDDEGRGALVANAHWPNLGETEYNFFASVTATIRKRVEKDLENDLERRLEDWLFNNFGGSLADDIQHGLWNSMGRDIPNLRITDLWGQQDSALISPYLFYEAIGLQFESRARRLLGLWEELARSCMWWWGYENLCFVCERPERMLWSENTGFHCADGPAITFRDGWGVYVWKGLYVPPEMMEAPVTLKAIGEMENIEYQRVLIDRYGLERYFEDSGAREVARDAQGVLLEMELPGGRTQQIVRVENPTPGPGGERRIYLLPLDGRFETPTDAIGSTFGLPPGAYKPTAQA